jgi:hypothetical protein
LGIAMRNQWVTLAQTGIRDRIAAGISVTCGIYL